ncbi:UNVERIFIED_CONTAM: hypothetical protein Sradi_5277700 [Sesamum radiatum]|uniref:Uncharacterized protein n=1 Tax=Sesamum radiatum TaxID=300843 RepID=A0AAW2LLJ3_SESRA
MAKGNDGQVAAVTVLSPTRLGRTTCRTWADGFLVTPHFKGTFYLPSFLIPISDFLQKPFQQVSSSSSDESILFVGENNPDDDPSEATSRMTGSQSASPSSGRRRSLRRMAAAFRRLIDEEEEETEGEAPSPGEGEKIVTNLPPAHPLSSVDLGPLPFRLLTSYR